MPSTWGHRQQYGEFKIVGAAEGHPKLLGEGSFGKTYEAVRSESVAGNVIEENVALKVLNPDLLNSATKRFQFVQERTALTRLKHANLIHSIKCGEDNGEVYFAMELCMGGDLSKLVKRYGALPERVAALIGLQAAAGLREMHRREMVHRDIKPPNIMLFEPLAPNCTLDELTLLLEENESLCRIVDFGLVGTILSAQGAAGHTTHQKFVGSMMYASPEQILERKNIDGRTDIYALGMTLWYLVQGRGPLLDARGDELKNATEAEGRHLSDKAHEADLPNTLSQEFRNILAQMVAKRPEERIANARELANALERYLERSARARSVGLVPLQSRERLQSFFQFNADSMKGIGRQRFAAEHCSTKQSARLTIVEDLDEISRIRPDFNEVVKKVCDLAQTLHQPGVPPALLPVQEVVWAADALAYAEDMPGDVTLAEVLQVRTALRRSFSFREAEVIFRPIADALDFLVTNGWDLISLPCEEVWLADAATARAPRDRKVLSRPLTEWTGLRVTFSGMWVPPEKGKAVGAAISFASTSQGGSSFLTAESLRPPVSAFLRLVYRTLSGSDVPDAADRWPNGYISSVSLQNSSNNLIRDLLCKQREWSSVSLILNELCANEGVSVDAPVIPLLERSGAKSKVGSTKAASGSRGAVPPSAPGSAAGPVILTPQSQSSAGSSSSRLASDANPEGPSLREARDAQPCEIISPGMVRLGDHLQEVSALEWVSEGKEFIKCEQTGVWYFFPPEGRGMFVGKVGRLKHVVSPFSGEEQEVEWSRWSPGHEVNCARTGHAFVLPDELPLPTGTLVPGAAGRVISVFDPQGPPVVISPMDWVAGARVICPTTGNAFVLPASLPPLAAVVDLRKVGWVSSPYAPDAPWTIAPTEWFGGREIICNATRNRLVLPAEVEQWVADVIVLDAGAREVRSPYHADARCIVPAAEWRRGGSIKCPPSGRPARLPVDLPLLVGQVVPGSAGVIRSPFSQDTIKVPLPNWITGREIVCPTSGQPFLLPPGLPVPDGTVLRDKPGLAFSPYVPSRSVKVDPLHWLAGEVLSCPATGERFKLPEQLPRLHAIVTAGDPGLVCSPFAPEASDENEIAFEFRVPIDDWVAGNEFECPVTRHIFVLPPDIEEWIQEGAWIAGAPGKVRSPFRNGSEIELSEAQWKPGVLITCPAARRRFRVPVGEGFPSLGLEKAAVQRAHAEPESDAKAAVAALKKTHREATEALITAIWARHHLDSVEKRQPKDTGSLVPGEPGQVISPYNQKRMAVAPETWVQPGASLLCETGKRFLLPPNRPPLVGSVDAKQPGSVTSPFAKTKPFAIKPWQWSAGTELICEHSGHSFVLPASLPAWVPEAALDARKPGSVINPFSPTGESLAVAGKDWQPENILSIGGSRQYKLPRTLPPLVASLEKAVRGKVESPYAPGTIIAVKPDLWVHGGRVTCTKTQREFLLPDALPDDAFEGIDPHDDSTIQSPYGSGQRFKVHALEWLGEGVVSCPETAKRIVLPKALPQLVGRVDAERPCEVRSPFDPDSPMALAIEDWIEGREVTCAKTQRTFRLPKEPLPLPFAEPAPGKPGAVRSPFRNGAEVLVPPLQWIEGGEVEDRTARRRFRLPKSNLPLLEAIPVTGRSLTVKSPFDTKAEIVVPLSDWTPGHTITCPTTDRAFVLPQHLEDPVLPAQLVEAQPGVIIDPYSNEEIQVPGPDWRENAIILSAQGHQILLPAKLPPLLAQLIDPSSPYHIRSPYDPNVLDIVPARKWTPGNIVKCGKRNVRLPDELPQPAPGTQTKSPFPLAAIATVCVLLLAAGAAALYFFQPPGEKNKPTVAETSKPVHTPAPEPVKPSPSPPKPIVVAETPKPTPAPTPKPAPIPPPPLPPTLLEQFEKQKLAGKVTGDFLREVLKQAKLKVSDAETQKLATDVLEFAKNQSDPETQQQALLAIAKRHGDAVTDAAFTAYLAAYKGSSAEARDWLVRNVDNFSAQFFEKAHGVLIGDDKAKFITAGKNAKKEEVAATSFYLAAKTEMQTSGPQALGVLTAYREAAVRKHPDAAKWLRANVVAKPVPNEPLKVRDPFSADGKTIGIPAGKWKANTVIDDQFFKLGPDLAPLPATFIAGKHRTPEGDAKGIIDDPYKDGPDDTIEVERQNWYRGALLKEENIVLPNDLPLMEAKVDPALFKSEGDLINACVPSPIKEGDTIPVAWADWKPGLEIKQMIAGKETVVAVLAPKKMPAEIDPGLPTSRATLKADVQSKSKPPVVTCMAVSPYSGEVPIALKDWIGGGKVQDTSFLKDGKGPTLSFVLPTVLDPIPGVLTDDYEFAYIDDTGETVTISLKEKAFEEFQKVTDFKHGAQWFRIVSYLNFIVEEREWQGFDPRRGKRLSKAESEIIKQQRSSDTERLSAMVELSGDFKKYAAGQDLRPKEPEKPAEPKESMAPEKKVATSDTKPKSDTAATPKPIPGKDSPPASKSNTASVGTKKSDSPPSKGETKSAPAADGSALSWQPSGIRSQRNGVTFRPKGGTLRSGKNANLGGNGEEAAKDQTAVLRGQGMPRSLRVYYDRDTNGFYIGKDN